MAIITPAQLVALGGGDYAEGERLLLAFVDGMNAAEKKRKTDRKVLVGKVSSMVIVEEATASRGLYPSIDESDTALVLREYKTLKADRAAILAQVDCLTRQRDQAIDIVEDYGLKVIKARDDVTFLEGVVRGCRDRISELEGCNTKIIEGDGEIEAMGIVRSNLRAMTEERFRIAEELREAKARIAELEHLAKVSDGAEPRPSGTVSDLLSGNVPLPPVKPKVAPVTERVAKK